MTPTRKRRLMGVALVILGVGSAAAIALYALRDNALFFYTPTMMAEESIAQGVRFRLGGLVVPGSMRRDDEGLGVSFVVTDKQNEQSVHYEGILPDLFREGQGVIARGRLSEQGQFEAEEVLAKHDENYMPPEVAQALEEAGHPIPKKPEAL